MVDAAVINDLNNFASKEDDQVDYQGTANVTVVRVRVPFSGYFYELSYL